MVTVGNNLPPRTAIMTSGRVATVRRNTKERGGTVLVMARI